MIAALERNHRCAAAAAAASVALAQTPLAMAGECALFVTAHPDDETMFFAPAILSLLRRGLRVALLCLSTGGCGPAGGDDARVCAVSCRLCSQPTSCSLPPEQATPTAWAPCGQWSCSERAACSG